jgi:hypothetical protein
LIDDLVTGIAVVWVVALRSSVVVVKEDYAGYLIVTGAYIDELPMLVGVRDSIDGYSE